MIRMTNAPNVNYKFFAIPLVVMLTITILSGGFIITGYAHNKKVKVGCKDLALSLITWDQLAPLVDSDDIAENEHILNDKGIHPDVYQDIVYHHLDDLLDDVQDKCNNLSDSIDDTVDDVDFNLP
jgi:hypothetical protein